MEAWAPEVRVTGRLSVCASLFTSVYNVPFMDKQFLYEHVDINMEGNIWTGSLCVFLFKWKLDSTITPSICNYNRL